MADGHSDMIALREKDRRLAGSCEEAALAASEGVAWLGQHREASPRIANLQKQLRRQAVEARRLASAAARPMSVGVFGASQSGKSFLIGKLINPGNSAIPVVFGEGAGAVRQNFLEEVNPAGGNETTGLVTRFTLGRIATPAGNPVALRLFREVDIVKILANTFLFDCKGQFKVPTDDSGDSVEDVTPTPERLAALASSLATMVQSRPQPGMSVEDVYSLREYFEHKLDGHQLADSDREAYWVMLEDCAPCLDAAGRARALAPLWGELAEFTELYLRLKLALDQLGHPGHVFTTLDALRDRSRGVLHVNTLRELDQDGPRQTLSVVTAEGSGGSFPTCVVTALTAELNVRLDRAPWPFFEHTDLLDFPGARSREDKPVRGFLRHPDQHSARADCFLRGKVAVLFDNYAADLDLNVMLLCSGPENQEVKTLRGLVDDWIARTHGDTPDKRRNRPVALFYCLTKCDTLFVNRTGGEAPVRTRLENNLGPYAAWLDTWTPGTPFDNLFLTRNPGVENRGIFSYVPRPAGTPLTVVMPETGLDPDFAAAQLDSFRAEYLAEPLVRRHIADAEAKLEAMLAINDGGMSRLAAALAPVCNPDLKYDQILPRTASTVAALQGVLTPFYDTGDLQTRLEDRTRRIRRLIDALQHHPDDIGPFIASFQADGALMEQAYRHYRRHRAETPPVRNVFDDLFGDRADPAAPPDGFGSVLVGWWARHMSDRGTGSPWGERLGLDEETLGGFAEEIVIGAERRGIAAALETRIDDFTLNAMPLDAAARRVALFASFALNDEVNFPGGRPPAGAEDPFAPSSPDSLHEDVTAMRRIRLRYFKVWMDGLLALTRDNASWGAGGTVDIEANAALGRILSRLSEPAS